MYGRTGKNNPNYGKILPQVVKNKLREINKNKIWITDGEITLRVDKDASIPDGFRRGRTLKKKNGDNVK